MLYLLNVSLLVNHFANVAVVYYRRVLKKSSIFWMLPFLFATDHRHIFCSSWGGGISEKSLKEIIIILLARNPCFKTLFPNCRSVILKECNTVNSTANLSTWAWYQNLVSWNGGIKGISQGSTALLPSTGYLFGWFPIWPHFCLFPHCRAWLQAKN